jgi:hypothetical protein
MHLFSGASERADRPNEPDPASDTGSVTDISALAGRRFVRFRVEFVSAERLSSVPPPEIESLRIRFVYP